MGDGDEIKNCTIEFQCPKRWYALAETDNPKVRFCHYCFQNVHLVKTHEELSSQAAQGRCVAILRVHDDALLGKMVSLEGSVDNV